MGTRPPTRSALRALANGGQPLPSRHKLSREEVRDSQRGRLVYAMLEASTEKGYHAVTIGDLVQRAGVSRQTFYEHFASKEECFLTAFDGGVEVGLNRLGRSLDTVAHDDWRAIVRLGVRAYLAALADEPAAAWALNIEALSAGPESLRRVRAHMDRLADLYRLGHVLARKQDPALKELPDEVFALLVGGMADQVRHCLRTRGAAALPELEDLLVTAVRVVYGDYHRA